MIEGKSALRSLPALLPLWAKRSIQRVFVLYYRGRTIRTVDNLKVRIGDDWIFGRVALHRSYEHKWTRLVQRFLDPGDRCIDVGANFGYFTLITAQAVGPDGTVASLEPNSRIQSSLKDNIELNDFASRVSVHRGGAGAKDGRARMENADASTGLGYTTPDSAGPIEIVRLDQQFQEDVGRSRSSRSTSKETS